MLIRNFTNKCIFVVDKYIWILVWDTTKGITAVKTNPNTNYANYPNKCTCQLNNGIAGLNKLEIFIIQ